MLFVSPECSPFSSLQGWIHPRMFEESIREHIERGMKHLAFIVLGCSAQHRRSRYFILEHPDGARSWPTQNDNMLPELPVAQNVLFYFCMAGMLSHDGQGPAPATKRTSLATTSEVIAATIERVCDATALIDMSRRRADGLDRVDDIPRCRFAERYARHTPNRPCWTMRGRSADIGSVGTTGPPRRLELVLTACLRRVERI